ncbi:YraN family protein [Moraxella sp. ZJ142]|uniref:YraN family protein n=1 Tax=Moraxella marmotae TaxID=3344520 RepID=UPI0035D48ECD
MPKTAKRQQGDAFEMRAAEILRQAGFQIVATNYTIARLGEIDIIARQTAHQTKHPSSSSNTKNLLVFVEVRSRSASAFGTAIDSITPAKQAKIYRTAEQFLQTHEQYADDECRFDVMAFDLLDGVAVHEWLVAAF